MLFNINSSSCACFYLSLCFKDGQSASFGDVTFESFAPGFPNEVEVSFGDTCFVDRQFKELIPLKFADFIIFFWCVTIFFFHVLKIELVELLKFFLVEMTILVFVALLKGVFKCFMHLVLECLVVSLKTGLIHLFLCILTNPDQQWQFFPNDFVDYGNVVFCHFYLWFRCNWKIYGCLRLCFRSLRFYNLRWGLFRILFISSSGSRVYNISCSCSFLSCILFRGLTYSLLILIWCTTTKVSHF